MTASRLLPVPEHCHNEIPDRSIMSIQSSLPDVDTPADLSQNCTSPSDSHGQVRVNIVALYILQGLNYVIPAAVLPFLVRVLGMERYGLIAFAQSLAQYFTLLTDYGFNFSATRAIAQQRDDREAVSRIVCSVVVLKLVLMLCGALIFTSIVLTVPRLHKDSEFFFVAYIAVVGNVLFPLWFFQGIEKMKPISLIFGATRLVGAIALFSLVHARQDALLALGIQSVTIVASGAIGLWVALRSSQIIVAWPTRASLLHSLHDGLHLFVSTAAISIYTNTNALLVGLLAGNVQVGYFSAAEKLVRAMQGLLSPVSQAVFPRMSALAARSREAAVGFALVTLRWMGGLSLGFSVMIISFANPIALLCFGDAASASVPIIRWLAFLPFLIAASNVFAVQVMIPFGQDRTLSRILVATGMVNLFFAPLLIHIRGAEGAGIAVICAEFIVTFATGLVASQTIRKLLRAHNS